MKKFALLTLTLTAMLAFTACGAEKKEDQAAQTVVETPAATDVVVETVSETEKVAKLSDGEGTYTTTLTLEDGKAVNIAFDYINADGSSKYEAAKNGEYVMSETGMLWNEQADALATFLVENEFDITKVTLDENGNTDAVTGVSIKVPEMLETAEALLESK